MTPTSAAAFEDRYRICSDPWNFAGSAYEQLRYEITIDALRCSGYDTVYEPGCSVGELTVRLAPICRKLVASDFAMTAVDRARSRCADFPHVEITCADVLTELPPGPFDLIVFSELGYYFDQATLIDLCGKLAERLSTGADFIAVHWLGHSDDHVLPGDVVHELLAAHLPLKPASGQRHAAFRLDIWTKS